MVLVDVAGSSPTSHPCFITSLYLFLANVMRQGRMRWFGHLECQRIGGVCLQKLLGWGE